MLIFATVEKKKIDRQIARDLSLDVTISGLMMQLSLSTAMARIVRLEPVREI